MDLMTRLKGMWHRHDERLKEEALKARAAGGDDLSLTPGLDRHVEERTGSAAAAAEHEEPE
jgi:hypothetical protein